MRALHRESYTECSITPSLKKSGHCLGWHIKLAEMLTHDKEGTQIKLWHTLSQNNHAPILAGTKVSKAQNRLLTF
jgi:hypothetical protein